MTDIGFSYVKRSKKNKFNGYEPNLKKQIDNKQCKICKIRLSNTNQTGYCRRQGKGSKDGVTILCPFFREEMFELMPLKKLIKARALQKAFKKDCLNAGVLAIKPSIHFHSLRHGFCTHAIEKGIDITRVKVLAGHSNIATTSVYTHLNPKIALDDFGRLF